MNLAKEKLGVLMSLLIVIGLRHGAYGRFIQYHPSQVPVD
jgi:hypothetical protein